MGHHLIMFSIFLTISLPVSHSRISESLDEWNEGTKLFNLLLHLLSNIQTSR